MRRQNAKSLRWSCSASLFVLAQVPNSCFPLPGLGTRANETLGDSLILARQRRGNEGLLGPFGVGVVNFGG